MAIQIISGSTTDQMTIDPVSQAARITWYSSDGLSTAPTDTYRGVAAINVRQTATTGAGVSTWAIYNNSSTKTVHIKSIYLQLFFDGTGAATLMKYEFIKGIGVTTFSGGTVVTPLHKRTSQVSPVASVRVLDTGVTTTGATFGGSMFTITQGRVPQTTSPDGIKFQSTTAYLSFEMFREFPIELALNEVFSLRQLATSVIGDNVVGYVEFAEV
jgi:hypothetical protein